MPKGNNQTNVLIRVKSLKDMPRVVDQIHTLVKRLAAGSGVCIEVTPDAPAKDTSDDEKSLL